MSNLRRLCDLMRDPESRRDRPKSETAEKNDEKPSGRNSFGQGMFGASLREVGLGFTQKSMTRTEEDGGRKLLC